MAAIRSRRRPVDFKNLRYFRGSILRIMLGCREFISVFIFLKWADSNPYTLFWERTHQTRYVRVPAHTARLVAVAADARGVWPLKLRK